MVVHLLAGLATVLVLFPFWRPARRVRRIRGWSIGLLRRLGVERRGDRFLAAAESRNRLLVANHVSWLDIFVLNAIHPARFVAKAEIRGWPLIGSLVAGVGTLFIERSLRRDAHRISRAMADAMREGDLVAVFPEGTTSEGRSVRHFHASLLQPVVDTHGAVLPVAIAYRTPEGALSDAVTFVGNTTFVQSFWRIIGTRRIYAEVHFLPEIPAGADARRRDLATAAETAIRTALANAAGESGPRTAGGHPGASP